MNSPFPCLLASMLVLAACGDSGTSAGAGGSGGDTGGGGSGATGGAGGSGGTGGCPGTIVSAAPWRCECTDTVQTYSDCAADACDGQTACEAACDGPVVSFEVAAYVEGATCDSICGYVDACCFACDVYFWCGIDIGESAADAETRLACKASQEEGWSCDANGNPLFEGPATCN